LILPSIATKTYSRNKSKAEILTRIIQPKTKLNWNSITNTGIVSEIVNQNRYQIKKEQIRYQIDKEQIEKEQIAYLHRRWSSDDGAESGGDEGSKNLGE